MSFFETVHDDGSGVAWLEHTAITTHRHVQQDF